MSLNPLFRVPGSWHGHAAEIVALLPSGTRGLTDAAGLDPSTLEYWPRKASVYAPTNEIAEAYRQVAANPKGVASEVARMRRGDIREELIISRVVDKSSGVAGAAATIFMASSARQTEWPQLTNITPKAGGGHTVPVSAWSPILQRAQILVGTPTQAIAAAKLTTAVLVPAEPDLFIEQPSIVLTVATKNELDNFPVADLHIKKLKTDRAGCRVKGGDYLVSTHPLRHT